MAKKDQLDYGDIDLEDDFNFDEWENTLPADETKKKDRSVITDVVGGLTEGAIGEVTNLDNIRKFMKGALPEGFGKAWDVVDNGAESVLKLYDTAAKELKPGLGAIATKLDRLTPDDAKITKKITSTLKEWFGEEAKNYGADQKTRQDEAVNGFVNSVFAAQMQQQETQHEQNKAEKKVSTSIDNKRFSFNAKVFSKIDDSLRKLSEYTTTFNMQFQKKSLELQYRSYLTQVESMDELKKANEISRRQMEGLLKNTALPEFVKIKESERFHQLAKDKLYNSAQNAIFGSEDRIKNGFQTLSKKGGEVIEGAKVGLEASMSGVEAMEMIDEMGKMSAEMNGEEYSRTRTAAQMFGASMGGKAMKKLQDFIRDQAEKDPAMVKQGNALMRHVLNPDKAINNAKNSRFLQTEDDDYDSLKGKAKEVFREVLDAFRAKEPGAGGSMGITGVDGGQMGATYDDERLRKVQVDIIPGYLARILREVTVLNTGDQGTSLLTYDAETESFKSTTQIAADIQKRFKDKVQGSNFNWTSRLTTSDVAGEDITEDEGKVVSKFLGKAALSKDLRGKSYDENLDHFRETQEFKDLSDDDKATIEKHVFSRVSGNDVDSDTRLTQLTKGVERMRRGGEDITKQIKNYISAGYGKDLEAAEVIKLDESGKNWTVNMDKYYEWLHEDPTGTSDVGAKEGIRNVKTEGIIEKIKKLKIFNWKYKPGRGDNTNPADPAGGSAGPAPEGTPAIGHTGPMAQNVNAVLGGEAAPGGKKIDLISLNGYAMAGIQELSKQIDKIRQSLPSWGKNDPVEGQGLDEPSESSSEEETKDDKKKLTEAKLLRLIAVNTGTLVKLSRQALAMVPQPGSGQAGAGPAVNGNFAGTGTGNPMVDSLTQFTQLGIGMLFKGVYTTGKGAVDGAVKAGETAKGVYDDHKDTIKKSAGWVLEKALNLTGKAIDLGSGVLFKTIPDMFKNLKAQGTKLKKFFAKLINQAEDLFIPGIPEAVIQATLLRAGHYRDSVTGKVIESIDDLQEMKGNLLNAMGETVVTAKQIADGLYTQTGQRIRTTGKYLGDLALRGAMYAGSKLMAGARSMVKGISNFKIQTPDLSWVKDKASGLLNNISGFSFYDRRSFDVLVQIRDLVAIGKPKKLREAILNRLPGKIPSSFRSTEQKEIQRDKAAAKNIEREIAKDENGESKKGVVEKTVENVKTRTEEFLRDKLGINGKNKDGTPTDPKSLKGKLGSAFSEIMERTKGLKGKDRTNALMDWFGEKFGDKKPKPSDYTGTTLPAVYDPNSVPQQVERNPLAIHDGTTPLPEKEKTFREKVSERVNEFRDEFKNTYGGTPAQDAAKKKGLFGKAKDLWNKRKSKKRPAHQDAPREQDRPSDLLALGYTPNASGHRNDDFELVDDGPRKPSKYARRDDVEDAPIRSETVNQPGEQPPVKKSGFQRLKDKVKGIRGKATGKQDGIIDLNPVAPKKGLFANLKGKRDMAVNAVKNNAGKVGGGLLKAAGGMFGMAGETTTEGPSNTGSSFGERAGNLVRRVVGKVGGFNDSDKDGRRDGHFTERLEKQEQERQKREEEIKAKEKEAKDRADTGPKYRSTENVIDTMINKAGAVFDTIGNLASSLFSLKGIGSLLGKIMGKALTPFKALFKAAGFAKNVAGAVGSPLLKAAGYLTKIPGATKILGAARGLATIAQVGGLAMGGTMGGVLSVAGTAITALGAALSSPVVIGGLAIAGAAYGAYKAYKYFTRNSLDEWEKLRVLQYGLDGSDNTKDKNSVLMNLEGYLLDSKIGYESGKAYLLDKKIDVKELLSMFNIDEKDDDAIYKFKTWLDGRFKPVFLTWVTALFSINQKLGINQISKLSAKEKISLLEKGSNLSGPYDDATSPFKEPAQLSTGLDAIKAQVKTIEVSLQEGADKEKSKDKESPEQKMQQAKKKEADLAAKKELENKSLASAVAPLVPPAPAKQVAPQDPKTLASAVGKVVGEDGKAPTAPPTEVADKAATTQLLNKAEGEINDGSNGMQYVKLKKGTTLQGVHPSLLKFFLAMAQEYGQTTGKSLAVTDAFRSRAEQERLYRDHPEKAAKPGNSMHEMGLAIDVDSKDLDELDRLGLMRKYGFTRPVGGERWHMEPSGIQLNLQKAKLSPEFADMQIRASLGRGGGGYGVTEGSKLKGRNAAIAQAVFNSGSSKDVDLAKEKDKLSPTSTATPTPAPTNLKQAVEAKSGAKPEQAFPPSGMDVPKGPVGKSLEEGEKATDNAVGPDYEAKPKTDTAATPSGPAPKGKEEVKNKIAEFAKETKEKPEVLQTFAAIESSMRPDAAAKGTSAKGAFQFLDKTWKSQVGTKGTKYGLSPSASPLDLRASTLMAAEYIGENRKAISSVKPNPTVPDLYTAHFLGAGGARKFFSAPPDSDASTVLPKAAASNKAIFTDGGRSLTVSQVYDKIVKKVKNAAQKFGIGLADSSSSLSQKPTGKATGDTDNTPTSITAAKPVKPADTAAPQPVTPSESTAPASTPIPGIPSAVTPPTDIPPQETAPKKTAPWVLNDRPDDLAIGRSSKPSRQEGDLGQLSGVSETLSQQLKTQKAMQDILSERVAPTLEKMLVLMEKGAPSQAPSPGKPSAPAPSSRPASPTSNSSSLDLRRMA